MNWRYLLGATLGMVELQALARAPAVRAYPTGRSWLYDVRRFAGHEPIQTIFDVGANIGQTAWGLTRFFPNSAIYCFEPAPETFSQLRKNYGKYKNVRLRELALGDSNSRAEMVLHENSEMNTLGSPNWKSGAGIISIPVQRLESFCAEEGLDRIDLLKMDVQGWEMNVLAGAGEWLLGRRIRFIVSEVGFDRSEPDMVYFGKLHELMCDHRYRFCGFYDQFRWTGQKHIVHFANVVYSVR